MVWPKRKVLLVVDDSGDGVEGVTAAILRGLAVDFEVAGAEDLVPGTNPWVLKETGPTEIVFWPGINNDNPWRRRALDWGLNEISLSEFLHTIWKDDILLPVSEPCVLVQGRPLLWKILEVAGFEPSLVWQDENGVWFNRRARGVHWVIPNGLLAFGENGNRVDKKSIHTEGLVSWTAGENKVDFYRQTTEKRFLGSLPRWPEPGLEEIAYGNVAQALNLGVSWFDIKQTLSLSGLNVEEDWLRWNTDDFGWDAGSSREKLSFAEVNNLEDRRAG